MPARDVIIVRGDPSRVLGRSLRFVAAVVAVAAVGVGPVAQQPASLRSLSQCTSGQRHRNRQRDRPRNGRCFDACSLQTPG